MIAASPSTAGSLYVVDKDARSIVGEGIVQSSGFDFGRTLLVNDVIATITYDVERVPKATPASRSTTLLAKCLKDGVSGEVRHTILHEVRVSVNIIMACEKVCTVCFNIRWEDAGENPPKQQYVPLPPIIPLRNVRSIAWVYITFCCIFLPVVRCCYSFGGHH
jgi:hypothetical protein